MEGPGGGGGAVQPTARGVPRPSTDESADMVPITNDLDPTPEELEWRRRKKVILFHSPEMDSLAERILRLDR